MVIVAIDDEKSARILLETLLRKVRPEAEVHVFSKPEELLEYMETGTADVAVLDICMYSEIDGVELAMRLKQKCSKINIIFATAHDKYLKEAMSMHASGYIMKPLTEEDVKRELDDLRHPLIPDKKALLRVSCFGNFEVFAPDNMPLHFERTKAKEAFAYLIYRRGASCTVREISALLFEDEPYSNKLQGYTQKVISSLVKTLKENGAGDVIIKKYNSLAVNPELIDCDYYRFEQMDVAAINSYMNEFMAQYSWAEFAPRIPNFMLE